MLNANGLGVAPAAVPPDPETQPEMSDEEVLDGEKDKADNEEDEANGCVEG